MPLSIFHAAAAGAAAIFAADATAPLTPIFACAFAFRIIDGYFEAMLPIS